MIHTFECILKSLEPPNNQPKSLPGTRLKNTKRRKRKECFPVSCQLTMMTIQKQLVKNNNHMYLFPWEESRVGNVR